MESILVSNNDFVGGMGMLSPTRWLQMKLNLVACLSRVLLKSVPTANNPTARNGLARSHT